MSPSDGRMRWLASLAMSCTLVMSEVLGTAPAVAVPAAAELPTWPANPNWQSLVPAPSSGDVRPVGVVRTHGSVTNPTALTGQSGGSTVLTVPPGGSPAIVVLDFGREVGGNPYVTVSAAPATSTTLGVATSEALTFLTRGTSGTYSNDNGAQLTFSVTGPRTYTGGLRGGFRFEAIQLASPGTVTLTAAGLTFAAYRATPDKYQGFFISSDDQLNRIWYAGAYTAQMDMVPTGVASCFRVPVIFDGAKRDRAIWSGDLMITDPVALLSIGTNGVPFVKGSIDSIMNLQATNGRLTSAVGFRGCGAFDYAVTYSAYSAIIAIQYYRYTGDTAYLTALRPKLEAATAFHATRLDANGLVVTNDPARIAENFDVFDFVLSNEELAAIDVLDRGVRGGPEPAAITLESFGREIPEA